MGGRADDGRVQTILVPPLLCSPLVYGPILDVAWAHGSVTVADTRHDDTVVDMAARLLREAPEEFALLGTSMAATWRSRSSGRRRSG